MNGNQAMIDFLITCPTVLTSPLFFNFGKSDDENIQFVTKTNDTTRQKPYIDGTVAKRYSFQLYIYKAITDIPLAKLIGYDNENVDDFADVQQVLDWIVEQEELHNYPNFGDKYEVEQMLVSTDTPILVGIDDSQSPPIATYGLVVNVDYLDKTKKLWED